MKILMIAHFVGTPNEKVNNRFNYLANLLGNSNDVELVTSTFSHKEKIQRDMVKEPTKELNYKFTTVYEPGYKKNVCLKRFYSHYIIGKNLEKYLFNLNYKPDVIYCAVPSLSIGKVAAKFAKNNNIRFIIDVQDLWPEAFEMVFKVPVINKILFYPMKRQANYIYKQADDIIAVSETYLNRAANVNKKAKGKLSVFLGTKLKEFDEYKEKYDLPKSISKDTTEIAYIGTLGHSYNIEIIIDAISILGKENVKNIKFIVMGDGPLKERFENYAKKKGINYEFTGRLSYDKMVGRLCNCDIAVNPISKGAAQSIINKVGDYAAAGLPVINTQENEEYRELVTKYKIGLNCENDNAQDVAQKIKELVNNEKLIKEYGNNNRKLAEEKFDREKTYEEIIDLINN